MPRIRPLPKKRDDYLTRQRIPITVTLPREVIQQINAICDREQRPRSQIMEWAALNYIEINKAAA